MTNAEKIRGMSDEELMKFMMEDRFSCEADCPERDPMAKYFLTKCSGKCDERCLEWLKRTAETEWRRFQRVWVRPAIIGGEMKRVWS